MTDFLLVKTGNVKFARRSVAIVGMLGCGSFILPAAFTASPYLAVYCLMGAMFFLETIIGPSWAVPMDIGGEYSGTVSGRMNMGGQIGGALSPTVFGPGVPGLRLSWSPLACYFSVQGSGRFGSIPKYPLSTKGGMIIARM
jgi:hypothetical protein